jgi:hypothetical protein
MYERNNGISAQGSVSAGYTSKGRVRLANMACITSPHNTPTVRETEHPDEATRNRATRHSQKLICLVPYILIHTYSMSMKK